jgi:hypothetical protein
MLVPKAAVNKDDFPARAEHKIRLSWKVFSMQRITVAHAVGGMSNEHLGRGIVPPHSPHARAPLSSR